MQATALRLATCRQLRSNNGGICSNEERLVSVSLLQFNQFTYCINMASGKPGRLHWISYVRRVGLNLKLSFITIEDDIPLMGSTRDAVDFNGTTIAALYVELQEIYNPSKDPNHTGQFSLRPTGTGKWSVGYRVPAASLVASITQLDDKKKQAETHALRAFLIAQQPYIAMARDIHDSGKKCKSEVADCTNGRHKNIKAIDMDCKFKHVQWSCQVCYNYTEWDKQCVIFKASNNKLVFPETSIQVRGKRKRELVVAPKFADPAKHTSNMEAGGLYYYWDMVAAICSEICKSIPNTGAGGVLDHYKVIQAITINFGAWEKVGCGGRGHTHFHIVLTRFAAEAIDTIDDETHPLLPLVACNQSGDEEFISDWNDAMLALNAVEYQNLHVRLDMLTKQNAAIMKHLGIPLPQ
jgi:hypothetical protein